MSTAGQAGGGLVGGLLGFLVGGPTGAKYGAQIGITLGGFIDPPSKKVEGPRLDDLSVQTSTYGAVIPRVYGTVTIVGNVFWLENNAIKETVTKKKTGGKGGGGKTTTRTYTYSATFAVGLCKGPILGVRRIWVGPDLFYDAGSTDPATIAASNDAATGFTLYKGTDTQSADARMQATLGAANVPAWRGLAYLVFNDLELEQYGNSLVGAQVKAEVFAAGSYEYYKVTVRDLPPVNKSWRSPFAWSGSLLMAINASGSAVMTSPDGVDWTLKTLPYSGTWYPAVTNGDRFAAPYYASYDTGGGIYVSLDDGDSWSLTLPATPTYVWTAVIWCGTFFIASANNRFATSVDGFTWVTQASHGYGAHIGDSLAWNGSMVMVLFNNWALTSPDGIIWTPRAFRPASESYVWLLAKGSLFLAMSNTGYGTRSTTDGISWTAYPTPIGNPSGACVDDDNFVIAFPFGFWVSPGGATWTQYTPVLPGSQGWALGFNGSIIAALMGGSQYGAATIQPKILHPAGTTLDAIVEAESLLSGILASSDIDVTSLTASVRGYRVGSLGAIRAALEPLRTAWPFDVVQRGYKIVCIARGGASIGTIPAADLDARAEGAGSGVQITTSREMDSQMPRRVTIQHLDYDREYDTGSQYAERLNTPAINALVHDLPIVLTGSEAAGKAEVLLYVAWLERHDVTVTLPPTYLPLEPADVVGLTTPEGVVTLRLTSINYTSDGRLECQAKYANPAVYTPTALGSAPAVSGQTTIVQAGPTLYHLLDIPQIHDFQAATSFVVAACGTLTGWIGGSLFQSLDAGATWDDINDLPPPGSTIGAASNTIGVVEHRMIDKASRLTVVMAYGELFTITEQLMLSGGNLFAYGADGRWEILAAQTCTLQSGTTYILSDFLRGRYGTEWAMGLHQAGDAVVLLTASDVELISAPSGSIGLARNYRAITSGRDISTDTNRAFTYRAVNLTPLSPIALTGNRHPSSNDWELTWVRRTRTGGEWRDNVDADIGEVSEQYQVDIFADGSYTTVKRTLTATTPLAAYTSADQVTDFGSNQATLYLKLYQMSTVVCRGYPLTTSITR